MMKSKMQTNFEPITDFILVKRNGWRAGVGLRFRYTYLAMEVTSHDLKIETLPVLGNALQLFFY